LASGFLSSLAADFSSDLVVLSFAVVSVALSFSFFSESGLADLLASLAGAFSFSSLEVSLLAELSFLAESESFFLDSSLESEVAL
jgi:hypothetical protein